MPSTDLARSSPGDRGVLPDEFMQRVRAFQESRILLTAIELDVFSAVGAGAAPGEVARRIHADQRGVDLLLHALAALELLEKRDDRFFNRELAARYLCSDSPHDRRAALGHSAALWHRWSHLTECVRSGKPAPRGERTDSDTESFIAAMHHNTAARAAELVPALDLARVRRVLDVGGGSAGYSIAMATAVPELHAEVLDLAEVTPIADRNIAAAGLSDRVTTRVGDLRADEFGSGYDLVLISAVCHMNGPEQNADLIRRASRALATGGRLAIHDFILDPGRSAPPAAALFSINMLVNTETGSNYTEAEYRDWMRSAGLERVQRITLRAPTALIVGSR